MVKDICGISCRVAGQAGGVFINIAAHTLVMVIGLRICMAA